MQTIAIVYGLFEGSLIGRSFIAECKRRGYTVVSDVEKADIIVAHSGGWLFLPANIANKQIVLINVSHKSNQSFFIRFLRRMAYDIRYVAPSPLFLTWVHHRVLNMWYFVTRFPVWIVMAWRFSRRDITPLIGLANVTVIQSADMSWYDAVAMAKAHRFIKLDVGGHDDCWVRPQVYLDATDL